jgi:hypothetical protein
MAMPLDAPIALPGRETRMQPRQFAAIMIFVGSYLPLSLILLVQNYRYSALRDDICINLSRPGCDLPLKNPILATSIFVACVLCLIATLVILSRLRPKREICLKEVSYVPADLMNYTLPYVVSFMSIDYQDSGKFVGLIIFLAWMYWISYKSGQIILNPVLIVFGWCLYNVKYTFPADSTEHTTRILANGAISPGERHNRHTIQNIDIVKVPKQGG